MEALSVHLTDVCNSKCTFCIVDAPYQHIDTIKRHRISRFLQENSGKGYKAVNIHGGEPTIRSDFLDILHEIKELGYPEIWLQTNGRSMSSMKFTQRIVDNGVSLFIISMHGADAEMQDSISLAKNSFVQAVKGIRNAKLLGKNVRINTVVCKQNYKQLPDIMNLVIDLGVDHINISALHTAGTALRNFTMVTPTYAEIRPYVFEAIECVLATSCVLTLEGFPYCTISGYEKYMLDWSEEKFKMLYRTFIFDDYSSFMNKQARVKRKTCMPCAFDSVCGGVYKEYIQFIGWDDEFEPIPMDTATANLANQTLNK